MLNLEIISWILKISIVVIFLQTLYFKFSGSKESRYIFSKIKMEHWGRYISAIGKLFASILIFIPKTAPFGAILSLVIITPAIILHLTILGIEVMKDEGLLFYMALFIFFSSTIILII